MEIGEIARAGAEGSSEAGEEGGFGGRVVEWQVRGIVEVRTHLISTIDEESRSTGARLAWHRAYGVWRGAQSTGHRAQNYIGQQATRW